MTPYKQLSLNVIFADCQEKFESDLGYLSPSKQILPEIRLYDDRHSFAANNIMSNSASINVISEILGHSNIKTTLHNYTQVTQSMSKTSIDDKKNYSVKYPCNWGTITEYHRKISKS